MVNFSLGEELQLIKDTIHDFSLNEIRSVARDAEKAGRVPEDLLKKYAELSMALIDYPEEVGGAGMDVRSAVVLYEELAWGDPAIAFSLDSPGFAGLVLRFLGNVEQQKKYLTPLGDPSNYLLRYGSVWNKTFDPYDTESVTVRYSQNGESFVLNGKGYYVHNFDDASKFVVLSLPEGSETLEDLKAFIVDAKSEGLSAGKIDDKLGLISFRTGELNFENVIAEDLLDSKDPVKALENVYQYFWLRAGAIILGATRAALEYATDYAQERVAFGQPIAKYQGLAFMVADMAILLEGARNFLWEAAWKVHRGVATLGDVAGALSQVISAADKIGPDSIQVLGGHGYIKDHPVEKWTRDAKAMGLLAGSLLVVDDVASKFIVKEGGK